MSTSLPLVFPGGWVLYLSDILISKNPPPLPWSKADLDVCLVLICYFYTPFFLLKYADHLRAWETIWIMKAMCIFFFVYHHEGVSLTHMPLQYHLIKNQIYSLIY